MLTTPELDLLCESRVQFLSRCHLRLVARSCGSQFEEVHIAGDTICESFDAVCARMRRLGMVGKELVADGLLRGGVFLDYCSDCDSW